MKRYEIIEHTADIGIKAYGKDLPELFINSALGMFDIIIASKAASPKGAARTKNITVEAIDKDQLLVKWLRELLFLFETKNIVPVAFNLLRLAEKSLNARIKTVPFDPSVREIRHQIKAVTYHNLSIKKVGGQFRADVIFDI